MRTLTMHKGQHQYVFRYNQGSECDVLEAVADLAADPASNFDWTDAATLSFQITCEQAASCLTAIAPQQP